MERSNISGMTVEEYRDWMKKDLSGLQLVNNAASIDDIVDNLQDVKLQVSSVNMEEYRDYISDMQAKY